ncbi:cytochrome P450 family protein [Mycobacterium xenopi 3993]|nr:cytochrome P450 family protein [Mycobacterium xenopi 3993]
MPLPPPLRDMQRIMLQLDDAVNAIIDERLAHPTDTNDLLNVLLHAENGTWPRKRVRDEALTFMLAGHETTANSMSWFWYLMALHHAARARMLDEIDTVLDGRRPAPTTWRSCPGPRRASKRRNGISRRCGSWRARPSRTTRSTATTSAPGQR